MKNRVWFGRTRERTHTHTLTRARTHMHAHVPGSFPSKRQAASSIHQFCSVTPHTSYRFIWAFWTSCFCARSNLINFLVMWDDEPPTRDCLKTWFESAVKIEFMSALLPWNKWKRNQHRGKFANFQYQLCVLGQVLYIKKLQNFPKTIALRFGPTLWPISPNNNFPKISPNF